MFKDGPRAINTLPDSENIKGWKLLLTDQNKKQSNSQHKRVIHVKYKNDIELKLTVTHFPIWIFNRTLPHKRVFPRIIWFQVFVCVQEKRKLKRQEKNSSLTPSRCHYAVHRCLLYLFKFKCRPSLPKFSSPSISIEMIRMMIIEY